MRDHCAPVFAVHQVLARKRSGKRVALMINESSFIRSGLAPEHRIAVGKPSVALHDIAMFARKTGDVDCTINQRFEFLDTDCLQMSVLCMHQGHVEKLALVDTEPFVLTVFDGI